MFTAFDVSVVIPSYNSCQTIEACLASIMAQAAMPLEVIVVDSSTDDTPQFIEQRFPAVCVHHLEQRTFPGTARNLGVTMARGKIVAFLDSDCIAAPDWIRRIVEAHNQGQQSVGGAVEVGNPASPLAWVGHLGEFREFLPIGLPRQVMHVPTCNISYRVALFKMWGGFPDAYYPQEDLLFNYMLNQQGIGVWFDPAIRVRHFCREDFRAFLSHQHRMGRVTHRTLRRVDLPGSFVARRAWLAWLASPFIGALKYVRTVSAFLHFPHQVVRHPAVLVLLAFGCIWWARGFAAGVRGGLSGIRSRPDPDEPIFTMLNELKKKGR